MASISASISTASPSFSLGQKPSISTRDSAVIGTLSGIQPQTPPPTTTTTKLTLHPCGCVRGGGRFGFSIAVKSSESADLPPPVAETPVSKPPKKPVYSMKKGQIVRVDKEKYLNSVNYLSVGHPPYYKGLDYIYEDRGEVLDIRIFETGEYALIAWIGVPTAPAWLPTDMLIKSDKLNYERI